MPRPERHRCPRCGGSGEVEFNGVHADTLALLRKQRREVSGAELARLAGCKQTAMNNRLAYLEELGFAVSRRYGRERLFQAVIQT